MATPEMRVRIVKSTEKLLFYLFLSKVSVMRTGILSKMKVLVIFGCSMLFSLNAFAQLSGSYTIDQNGTASSTVYNSITDFVTDLKSGSRSDGGTSNGPGVSGAVKAKVKPGTGPYEEQIVINEITGASASNTVTISGSGEILKWDGDYYKPWVVFLDSADYVIIDSFQIQALDNHYGQGVRMAHQANYNSVSNCEFYFPNLTRSFPNSFIELSDISAQFMGSPGTGNRILNNYFHSDSLNAPAYAIRSIHSEYKAQPAELEISENIIQGWAYSAISISSGGDFLIQNNDISNPDHINIYTTFIIYIQRNRWGGNQHILGNYIHGMERITSSNHALYGVYIDGTNGTDISDMDVSDNRIVFSDAPGNAYGMYHLTSGTINKSSRLNMENNYVEITLANKTSTRARGAHGIYFAYAGTVKLEKCRVSRNKVFIHNPDFGYGIYLFSDSSTAKDTFECSNNVVKMVTNGSAYGVLLYIKKTWQIVHNTVSITNKSQMGASGQVTYGILTNASDVHITNNLIFVDVDGINIVVGLYCVFTKNIPQYNNILVDSSRVNTRYYAYWDRKFCTSAGHLKMLTTDSSNLSVAPEFIDLPNNNLRSLSLEVNNGGIGIPGVRVDTELTPRNHVNPDIGAYEGYFDLELDSLFAGNQTLCVGDTDTVQIQVTNRSDFVIQKFELMIYWKGDSFRIEGKTMLNQGDSALFTLPVSIQFDTPGVYTLNVLLAYRDEDTYNNHLSITYIARNAPVNFNLVESPDNKGIFLEGSTTSPDIGAPGNELKYHLESTSYYPDNTYGSQWRANVFTTNRAGDSADVHILFTAPSTGNPAIVSINPSDSFCDSLFFAGVEIVDLITGCSDTIGRWFTVYCMPKPDFSFSTACSGSEVEFSNNTDSLFGLDYKWFFGDSASGTDNMAASYHSSHVFDSAGTYQIKLKIISKEFPEFCDSIIKLVQVGITPDANFKGSGSCLGSPIRLNNLSVPASSGALSYKWLFGNGDSSIAFEPVYQYPKAGQYQIKLIVNAGKCSSDVTKSINQYPSPKADFVWTGRCSSDTLYLSNLSSIDVGQLGFTWDLNGVESHTKDTALVINNGGLTFDIKLEVVSEYGCIDSITRSIVLDSAPYSGFSLPVICSGEEFTLETNGGVPGKTNTYLWVVNATDSFYQQKINLKFKKPGSNKVELVIISSNGCKDSTLQMVDVKPKPIAGFTVSDACHGDSVHLINRTQLDSGFMMVYEWRFGDGMKSTQTSPYHQYQLLVDSIAETFNVTLVAKATDGCTDSTTKPVTVNPLPNPYFEAHIQGNKFMLDSLATSVTGNKYTWTFGNGDSSKAMTPTYTYPSIDSLSYRVCLFIINDAFCEAGYCQVISAPVGVHNLQPDQFVLFPNPANTTFRIEQTNTEVLAVSLYDSRGVFIPLPVQVNKVYNISHLAAGVYSVWIKTEQAVYVKRLVVH